MKICKFEIASVPCGKHNLKDPRLDEANELVEAKKKTPAQVEVIDDEDFAHAESILTTPDGALELIFRDLEFIEKRLGRDPVDNEKGALEKLRVGLEMDKTAYQVELSPEEREVLSIHHFTTNKPVVVASAPELANLDDLMLRAFRESGYISFLTVGGKENRAWPVRCGSRAWEAAGTIHTDIQKGFIRAEVISFSDFVGAGGETQAKRAGKQRLETKTYLMQDYDLVNFRFSK